MGKTNPLNEKDLAEFVDLQKKWADTQVGPNTENSWTLNIKDINQETFDLSVKNPNTPEEAPLREPKEILESIKALDEESAAILNTVPDLIKFNN